MKSHYVKQLFRLSGILEPVEGYPGFYYAGRRIHLPECDVFMISERLLRAKGDAMHHPEPIVGHYQYNADMDRQMRLRARPGPGGLMNEPVQHIFDIRLKEITPENWLNDPFLVCVLLSLAQVHWSWDDGSQPRIYSPRLLVTNKADSENAYVFAADIPSQFLDGLMNPNRSIGDIFLPPINFTKVPFEPYINFAERIQVHLLGAEWASGLGLLRPAAALALRGEKRARSTSI
ncbi:hypothetical protein FBEOM_13412 [Fusarium beomiforme]|uniref:Uncharacterized protein n=1 Tax=Fusarium beomiforme TaxID=44412 RepID=A0A9P5A6B4_9HYPO|nr:hypothetical protein FBEOM_13412 [Fusarium beomiforme]